MQNLASSGFSNWHFGHFISDALRGNYRKADWWIMGVDLLFWKGSIVKMYLCVN
jgi:hypothetical protein